MMEKSFVKLVEKVANGEMKVETLLNKIEKVAHEYVASVYRNEFSVDEDQVRMLIKMFQVVVLLDEKNIELQADLYALIMTAQDTM